MKVHESLAAAGPYPRGAVVSVGNFDGVHLGHQAILARAGDLARQEDMPLVAVTFEPAPVKLLRPHQAPKVLTPLPVKLRLLDDFGVDETVVIEPTGAFLSQTAEQFAQEVLAQALSARHVVEGQTFSFGQRRQGTIVSLQELGRRYGFTAHLTPARKACLEEGVPAAVSSTVLRGCIQAGKLTPAWRGLGRFHMLVGTVAGGRGLGRKLGYPTANLALYSGDQLVGPDGVFAAWARYGATLEEAWTARRVYGAAVSIGGCDTFADGQWQIEAHLLDYDGGYEALYGQHLLLEIVAKVRDQVRFADAAALVRRIEADCATIRETLAKSQRPRV